MISRVRVFMPFPEYVYAKLNRCELSIDTYISKRQVDTRELLTPTPEKRSCVKSKADKPEVELIMKVLEESIFDHSLRKLISTEGFRKCRWYLSYVLTIPALDRLWSSESQQPVILEKGDFLDLSKRRDETLKKVMSVVLKLVYKEYLLSQNINQNLNPRRYMKRSDVNRKIFKKYFGREPQLVKKGNSEKEEHLLLFFIKEGVTEEWFESIVGLRNKPAEETKPNLEFLAKLLFTLESDNLIKLYKRKVRSMVRKVFEGGRQFHYSADSTEEAKATIEVRKDSGKIIAKKPKTALGILQFQLAVEVAKGTLRKLMRKHQIDEPTDLIERIKNTSLSNQQQSVQNYLSDSNSCDN